MIAHVGGVPIEELVPAAAGAGTALLVARAWVGTLVGRAIKRAPPRAPTR